MIRKNFKSNFDFENTPFFVSKLHELGRYKHLSKKKCRANSQKFQVPFFNFLKTPPFYVKNYTNWVNMNIFQKFFSFFEKIKNVDKVTI